MALQLSYTSTRHAFYILSSSGPGPRSGSSPGDLEGLFKRDLEVDLERDSEGDFKQDLDGDLLSSRGPGQVRFSLLLKFNFLERDSEGVLLVFTNN